MWKGFNVMEIVGHTVNHCLGKRSLIPLLFSLLLLAVWPQTLSAQQDQQTPQQQPQDDQAQVSGPIGSALCATES
jgi:hypothetical protein